MVNRHKSSVSGHVNLFFLAIIVANYTYTNGPLSIHLNVHSMFIHFQCRLAHVSSATYTPRAVFGFHRWKPALFALHFRAEWRGEWLAATSGKRRRSSAWLTCFGGAGTI